MKFDEIINGLSGLVSNDSQAERSDLISEIVEALKESNSLYEQLALDNENLNSEYLKLQDENRKLFLKITEAVEEVNGEDQVKEVDLDDLFDEEGNLL